MLMINGIGELGFIVYLYQNGVWIVDIIVGNFGVWSYVYIMVLLLVDDIYIFIVMVSDSNGNIMFFLIDFMIIIDIQVFVVFGVIGVVDGDGNMIDINQIIQEFQFWLSGSGIVGDIIIFYDNGNVIGQVLVGMDGCWQFMLFVVLGDGDYYLIVCVNDLVGNESFEFFSFILCIDIQVLDVLQIVLVVIIGGEGEVLLVNGSIINQCMLIFSGIGEFGVIIILYNNGVELVIVQVNLQGSWIYLLICNLSEGLNILMVIVMDVVDNSSFIFGVFFVIFDIQFLVQFDVLLISDNVVLVIGNIGNNGVMNDIMLIFSGMGEIGSMIIFYNNGSEIGCIMVGDNGSWNFMFVVLMLEIYIIIVMEIDRVGNISLFFVLVIFMLDIIVFVNLVIIFVEDNVGEVQDIIVSGVIIDDNILVIYGIGDIGSIIMFYNGSSVLGVVIVDEIGIWMLVVISVLLDGVYILIVIVVDVVGNSSGVLNSFIFIVDIVLLQLFVVNEIFDDVVLVIGLLIDGVFINDWMLIINGSGENGSIVMIYDNGVVIGMVFVIDGVWIFNMFELLEVSYVLIFSVIDDVGNIMV